MHAESPEGSVIIQADELASVKAFTAVLDAARSIVPHDKISLATDEK
jgi:biopolymer transport protein ExbD